jgi:uncharacterized protein (DUF1810 family)
VSISARTPSGPGAPDLERFVQAQQGIFFQAVAELSRGFKTSHWMWFIFPQLKGLGASAMSQRYSLASVEEARLYLAHPVLGPRLRQCTAAVNAVEGHSAEQVFGKVDAQKFCSSMTLFHLAEPEAEEFSTALQKYFGGREDPATLALL